MQHTSISNIFMLLFFSWSSHVYKTFCEQNPTTLMYHPTQAQVPNHHHPLNTYLFFYFDNLPILLPLLLHVLRIFWTHWDVFKLISQTPKATKFLLFSGNLSPDHTQTTASLAFYSLPSSVKFIHTSFVTHTTHVSKIKTCRGPL